jgi:hypothetical protein
MTKEQRDELTAAETELRGALAEIALMTGPRGQAEPGRPALRFARLWSVSNTRPITSGKRKGRLFR